MTYANIKLSDDEKHPGVTHEIDPFLKPLIEKVSQEHPEWTISVYGNCSHAIGGRLIAKGFVVKEMLEKRGVIALGVYGKKKCYVVYCFREEDVRILSIGLKFTDIKKAIRQIDRLFKRKSLSEKSMYSKIRNCKIGYKCNRKWVELTTESRKPKIRFCDDCKKHVYLCETEKELISAIKQNMCVAVINCGDFERTEDHSMEHEWMGMIKFHDETQS